MEVNWSMGYITGLADRVADILDLKVILYHLTLMHESLSSQWSYFSCAYYQRTIVNIVMPGLPPWRRNTVFFLLASDQTEHYLSLCGTSWSSPKNNWIWCDHPFIAQRALMCFVATGHILPWSVALWTPAFVYKRVKWEKGASGA